MAWAWLLCPSATSGLLAAPEPSVAPTHWELDFEFHDPAAIDLSIPGQGQARFWYLLYTVTNNTGREVEFFPSFHLVTETMEVVEGGAGISPVVYDAVLARHRKQFPFLMEPWRMVGVLRQGEDNQRTSVAVFRNFDPEANRFTVYVGGLSGEITRVSNPSFDPQKAEQEGNRSFFVLRKTLAVTYDLPGDVETRRTAVPGRVHRDWVMR